MNKFYITTSIAYANAPPHIGFALESAQADALARWHRQKGEKVFFLTGTDEHGAKIARAADAAGKTPKELVDENAEKFRALKDTLNLSWDGFIRTSDKKTHWPVAQELWQRLGKAGDLYKKAYRGLYCVGHEAFVTQKDLEGGECRDHKKAPEVIEEENWFFRLSKYTKEIELRIRNNELRIVPETRENEVLSFLKEGLEDISFSRPSKDLSWGVPVPGDDTQTMYVWADALTNYISGYGLNALRRPTAEGGLRGLKKWEEHPADVHLIGKDILRFHAVIWPAMLLSAGLKLPKAIYVHGHILSDGQKMSKSLGNVVDPFELVKKYGTDAVRYYFLKAIPSGEDGDFSYEKFEKLYNGDLANGLGNLVARVTTLGERLGDVKCSDGDIIKLQKEYFPNSKNWFEEHSLDKMLLNIWEEIHTLDRELDRDKPWLEKNKVMRTRRTKYCSLQILHIANTLKPFLPETAEKILSAIRLKDNTLTIKKLSNLFPRI